MEFELRPIKEGDGGGINALRRMPGVFENILGIPSERIRRSDDFIANMNENSHQFVAVAKDEDGAETIVGTAGLYVYTNPRTRHCGGIGIMVHRDYQGMGVGTALMQALIDIADNWLKLVRVELTVFCDNEHAIRLYQKLGFEIEGTKRLAAIRRGIYTDEYIMARIKE